MRDASHGGSPLTPRRIPNHLHFCFALAKGRAFGLSHYACIASAVEVLKPTKATLYFEIEPDGYWWDKIRAIVDCTKVSAPREIFGRPLPHPAHRADIVRLEKLIESGGIYLDTDVFVHRSFDHLFDRSVVLGREGALEHAKIGNAVIMAEPNAPFLLKWYDEYRDFRGTGGPKHWNEHSILRPALLARKHPDEVTILSDRAFFWPLFDDAGIEAIFAGQDSLIAPDTLATHLWENKAWHKYLNHLTPSDVKRRDGNFYRWARPYVEDAPDEIGKASPFQKIGNRLSYAKKRGSDLNYRVINKLSRLSGLD